MIVGSVWQPSEPTDNGRRAVMSSEARNSHQEQVDVGPSLLVGIWEEVSKPSRVDTWR